VEENTSGVYYKHFRPNERIVGKRGRKQRQTSEALATNSLGEKSEIVIFRDVLESRRKATDTSKEPHDVDLGEESPKSLTAADIQAAMSGDGQAPDEDEVIKSIESLRPQAPVIEEHEYDDLTKELLGSYNRKQLSRYLSRLRKSSLSSTTVVREIEYRHWRPNQGPLPKRTISFTRSRWQPGRTLLDKRRLSETPATPPTHRGPSKAEAVEKIVREAWGITTRLEEQRMGELEIQMTPWAIALFFDTNATFAPGKPKYHGLIDPPFLLRRSEIRPYRADNVIRITARRQDAEDIATQLENKVLLMGKQVVQLDKLISISGKTAPQGQSLQHFRKRDLDEISRRTSSIFLQQSDGSIGIYSFKQSDRLNARRLILSLLDLPSQNVKRIVLKPSTSLESKAESASLALVPVFPNRGLHFRDRAKTFARATLPVQRTMPRVITDISYHKEAARLSGLVSSLVEDYDEQKQDEPTPAIDQSSDSLSVWAGRPFRLSPSWWVHLGLLLQESSLKPSGLLSQDKSPNDKQSGNSNISSKTSVFLNEVPAYETLLSYFEPSLHKPFPTLEVSEPTTRELSNRIVRKSTIIAHFTPNVFSTHGAQALKLFPKLELTLLRRFDKDSEASELKIEGLRGIIGEQLVDIPLPEKAADIRLSRKVSAYANTSAIVADPEIQQFVTAIKQSAKGKDYIQGTMEVTFKLPGWMHEKDDAIRKAQDESLPEIGVSYMFDRFEQVQSTSFKKNIDALNSRSEHSAAVSQFNKGFPRSASLRYNEVEAGEVGARRTEIMFKVPQSRVQKQLETAEGAESKTGEPHQLASQNLNALLVPALSVVDFVTRAYRQEIKEWRGGHVRQVEASQSHEFRPVGLSQTSGAESSVEEGFDEEGKIHTESE
jgi:hypothetical protein